MQRYLLLIQRIQTYTWQNNIIKNEIDENGWESVHNKLSQISSTNEKYYFVDGYDNFRNLRVQDINNIIDEINEEKSLKI